jgi:uncharacterized membrane protein YfhO
MKIFNKLWPYLIITAIILLFFKPIFKGQIPFPGDLLINQNPYRTETFLGFLPGSYPNKAQGPDVIYEIYPWKYFSINQIKLGQIPFWNPYNFSGNPQMANFQSAVFYPFNFLFLVLPFNAGWTMFTISQALLAAIFMFLFLSKGLKLNRLASVLGGISFAFSSYMVVWLEWENIASTLLWLPLALLLIKKNTEDIKLGNFLLLIFVFLFSFLAGYVQGFFYVYTVCLFYFLFLFFTQPTKQKAKKIVLFLTTLIFPVLLSLFQLFPTLEIFKSSTRGAYSLAQISQSLAPIYYWITIVFPDFFGNPAARNYWLNGTYIERVMYPGIIVLFFAVFAILKVKTKEKKFFLGLGILSLIIATNLPLVKYFYLLPIPVISTTVPTREFSIFIFSMVILGSIGISHWLEDKKSSKFPIIFFIVLLSFFIPTLVLNKFGIISDENLKISIRNMLLPTGLSFVVLIIFYLKNKLKTISLILLVMIMCFDLFYFFNKITPFSPSSFTYPGTPVVEYLQKNAGINRFWGYGSGYVSPNFQSVDKTYSPEGNDPLHLAAYGELLASSKYGELPKILPRPDANIAGGYGNADLRNNKNRQRILNLLGIKFVLHKDDLLSGTSNPDYVTFPQDRYSLVWQKNPWQVYENKQALPRFYLADNYEVIKDKDQRISRIYDESIDLQKTLILEEKPDIVLKKISKKEIKLLAYQPNKLSFKVNTDGNGLFFISDNYFPGWKATVDGKEVRIYKANYSFRAVPINKGEHELVMSYSPQSFFLGFKVSLIGLVLLLLYSLFFKKIYEK